MVEYDVEKWGVCVGVVVCVAGFGWRVRAVLFGCQGCSKLIECEDVGHAWSVDAADLLDSRVGAVLFDSGGWVVE